MIELIKVTAKTPNGDSQEYMFMGDLDTEEDQGRLIEFMLDCCDDCSDRFSCPDNWEPELWRNSTRAMWEAIDSERTSFGKTGLTDFFHEVIGYGC